MAYFVHLLHGGDDLILFCAEVGPFLGIAKSSSLESLQTAVETCIAEQNADPSVAKPLPKVSGEMKTFQYNKYSTKIA